MAQTLLLALSFTAFGAISNADTGPDRSICKFTETIGTVDGYKIFEKQQTRFWLVKRSESFSKVKHDIHCLHTGMNATLFGDHGLTRTFYYRYNDTTVAGEELIAMADINMTFFPKTTEGVYDWMNSTIPDRFVYELSPPVWTFKYANENCTVVEVPSEVHETQKLQERREAKSSPMPKCELWRSESLTEKLKGNAHPEESITCCETYFQKNCDALHSYTVFKDEWCK